MGIKQKTGKHSNGQDTQDDASVPEVLLNRRSKKPTIANETKNQFDRLRKMIR
jgi:hypothetical protein